MSAKVLVVDDDPVNVELLGYLLRAFSYEPRLALDGAAALATVAAEVPDLILCDIQMPEMDGFEVLRRLRADARTAAVPILGVTALAMVGDRKKILAAGFDGYLAKPIAPESFIQEIEKYLPPALLSEPAPQFATVSGGGEVPSSLPASSGYVLVVDDHRPNLDLLHHMITSLGFDVVCTADAKRALEIARDSPPSVVISDLHMPSCSGLELLETMKGNGALRDIPFYLISATNATVEEERRARASGAAGFLGRPLDPETILECLGRRIPAET